MVTQAICGCKFCGYKKSSNNIPLNIMTCIYYSLSKIMTHCDYNSLYFCLEQIQERRKNNPLRISTALEKLCTTPLKTALTSS